MAQNRKYYAEDIASAMERLDQIRSDNEGFLINATEVVANEMGIKSGNLKAMLGKARDFGFSCYPSRAS